MRNFRDRVFLATFSEGAPQTANKYGFSLEINDLCISSNLEPENRLETIKRIEDEIVEAKAQGKKLIMHGPFTELTPDAMDPRVIELMVDRYMTSVEICERFGIKDMVVHSGYIPLMYHRDWHVPRSIEFWQRISDMLPNGFTLYVENVFDEDPYILQDVIKGTDRRNIRGCLDVGHANAIKSKYSIYEWIDVLKHEIGHFHLHTNDGTSDQHGGLESGDMDMKSIILHILNCCTEDVTFTVESRESEPSAIFLENFFNTIPHIDMIK